MFDHSKLTVERIDQSQLRIRFGSAINLFGIISVRLYDLPPSDAPLLYMNGELIQTMIIKFGHGEQLHNLTCFACAKEPIFQYIEFNFSAVWYKNYFNNVMGLCLLFQESVSF